MFSYTFPPQALYLDPLLQRVRTNGGLVYPQSRYLGVCTVVTLMVDVKDTPRQSAERSFDIIHSILQAYAGDRPTALTDHVVYMPCHMTTRVTVIGVC
jgi:hypothetical protein